MIRRQIASITHWLKRVVTQPGHELDRWQRAARFAYDLGRYGARQLRDDRAPQVAAALAFRALFALFPVLVVSTVLVRAVIGVDEFLRLIDPLLASTNLGTVKIVLPAETMSHSETLRQWLDNLVGEAATINLTAIGWIGLSIVVYAAIGLMVTIENAFNIIYRVSGGRSWRRRVPLYWFILTISPVAIGVAAYINGYFESWIQSVETWQWALVAARVLWSCFFGWLFMFAVYTLIPNATVEFRPALVGALVAVLLLEFGLRTLGAYLETAFSISQLYGSLGLIPLFMFWVYLMWLAVLFGLEVSATLQLLRGRRIEEIEHQRELTGLFDPASTVTVMEVVADHFYAGNHTTAEQIADETCIAQTTVTRILERLIAAGFLHRLGQSERAVCLARPPDQVRAAPLIELGFQLVDEGDRGRRSCLFDRLRQAQLSSAENATLATLALQ